MAFEFDLDKASEYKPSKYENASVDSMLEASATIDYLNQQTTNDTNWKVLSNVGNSFLNGFKGTGRGVLRGLQWIRDWNESELKKINPEHQMDANMRTLLDSAADSSILQRVDVQADSTIGQFGYDVVEGAGQLAGQAAIGIATLGTGTLPAMALQIGGEEYKELRDKGIDVNRASEAALANAVIQTPLEYIGFTKIMKKFPADTVFKQRMRLAAENAFTEGVTEFLQEYPEQISKIWAENGNLSNEEIAKKVREDFGNITEGAIYSGAIGGTLGGLSGSAHIALDKKLTKAMEKEVHALKDEAADRRAEEIKSSGVNPMFAADTINENLKDEPVYIDAQAINAYAQEAGIGKVAETLGVSVDEITEAAENGDTLDIKTGNFDAANASLDGFREATRKYVSYEDGGYTVANEEAEKEAIKLAEQNRQALQVEKDRLTNEMLKAGVTPQVINAELNLLTRATFVDNPVEMLKKLHVQKGADGSVTFAQAQYRSQATSMVDYVREIKEANIPPQGKGKFYYEFSTEQGNNFQVNHDDMKHAVDKHGLTDEQIQNIEENIENIVDAYRDNKKPGHNTGIPVMAKIKTPIGMAGVSFEFLSNGKIGISSMFYDTDSNIDNWMKKGGSSTTILENQASFTGNTPLSIFNIQNALGIVKYDQLMQQAYTQADEIKKKYEGTEHWLKAPNGNDSNLSERLWCVVRTEAFKNWFGDWENDPANASKVVDENGEPKVMYHYTNAEFDTFDLEQARYYSDIPAFFFSDGNEDWQGMGDNVIEAFLNIRNPVEKPISKMNGNENREKIIQQGYDGTYMTDEGYETEWAALYPTQIKSIDNNGNFDASNPNIYMQSAWHGTPYRYTNFDLGAIGSGEGNLAHGWGLYFAANRKVSEGYQKMLALLKAQETAEIEDIEDTKLAGKTLQEWYEATGALMDRTPASSSEYDVLRDRYYMLEQTLLKTHPDVVIAEAEEDGLSKKAIAWYKKTIAKNYPKLKNPGTLFEADIPNDDVMLNEQLPLEKQPEKVRIALASLGIGYENVVEEAKNIAGEKGEKLAREYFNTPFVAAEENEELFNKKTALFDKLAKLVDPDLIDKVDNANTFWNIESGKLIYQQLAAKLGSAKNASLALNDAGIKGIKYNGLVDGTCYVVFDDKAINIINTYNQDAKGSYNPETNVISLFHGSDPSTVIHETWHFFIEQMYSAIARGEASQQVVNDFDKLLNYAGMDKAKWQEAWQKREEARAMLQTAMETFDQEGAAKARQAISEATSEMRDTHEKLAEAGETYLMEGKAPSHELKRVFRQFAKWLKDVYRTINRNPNAIPLTDDVREVFDRMLAAEDDINEMARINGYFNSLPKVITDNMSDYTKAKVEAYIAKAKDKAIDILTKKTMKPYLKERRKERNEFRTSILPDVEKEVSEYRVYKCGVKKSDTYKYDNLIKKQANGEAITDTDAEFILQTKLAAENNVYSSVDEMFKDIRTSPLKEQVVTELVNERVDEHEKAKAGEIAQHEDEVKEAIYNNDEGLLIAVEQQLIENYANQEVERQNKTRATYKAVNDNINAEVASARRQQARTLAQSDISKMSIQDAMRTNKFITAERKAAVSSARYVAAGKFKQALTQKNLQAYWHAMASESIKVKRNKQKNDKFLNAQLKAKREAYFDDECFGAVSQLFVRMGIAREKHIEAATNSPYPSLSAYVEAMLPKTDIIDIADWIINEGVDISNTNALTLEQYNDVVDAIKNIKAVAKDLKGTNMFNTKQNYQQLKVEMKKALNKLPVKFTPNPNEQQTAGTFETYFASLENLDTMLEKLDDMSFGFFSKHFGNEIKHCNDREYEHKYIYDKACKDALDKWLPTKQERLAASEPIYYGELNTSLSRFSLVQLLMNFGNADNAKRVCETPPVGLEQSSLWVRESETVDRETARQMTEENVLGFLQRVLNKSDIEYAQNIINACGLFWGEKNELERRTKGFGMNKVEATPRVLNINGETVVKRGGYFPLVRNSEMGSHAAAVEIQPDDPLQGQNIRTYHVNEGATKKRTNARYPISLVAGAEKQWMYESIHDLCWRETMSDFRRIINDEEMFGMLKSRMGLARFQAFKEMLEYAADPNNSKSMQLGEKGLSNIIGFMQQRTSHAAIMLNLKVVSQNFANAFLYGNSVEGYTMADNLHALGNLFMHNLSISGYNNMYNFVMSKSAFMRERQDIPDITIRDILQGQKGKTSQKLKQLGLMNESGEFKWEEYTRLVGVKLMAITDNMTALPNWIQAYNKQIANGATEQEAVDFADTVCRRVLGSSRVTDVAPIQRGKPLMKMLTMFQSFFNARWNEFLRMEKTTEKQWRMGEKKEAFATAFSYIVSKWLLQSTMALALAAQNPFGIDDKDGWPELLKELKNYSFTMMGWCGQIAGSVFGTLFGMNEFDYRMSAIEPSISKLNIAAKRIKSDKATGQDVAEGLMDIGGMAIGIPSQLNKLFWNAYDMTFNDMSFKPQDIFRRRPKKERND